MANSKFIQRLKSLDFESLWKLQKPFIAAGIVSTGIFVYLGGLVSKGKIKLGRAGNAALLLVTGGITAGLFYKALTNKGIASSDKPLPPPNITRPSRSQMESEFAALIETEPELFGDDPSLINMPQVRTNLSKLADEEIESLYVAVLMYNAGWDRSGKGASLSLDQWNQLKANIGVIISKDNAIALQDVEFLVERIFQNA